MSKINKQIEKARFNNASNKIIYEVLEAVEKYKPLYKDAFYKEGYEDCLHLIKRALRAQLPK